MVKGCHLTDEELAAFGVTRNRDRNKLSEYLYKVPCDVCGELIEISLYNTSNVYKCKSCKEKQVDVNKRIDRLLKDKIEHEEADEIGIDYEHYQRFESAANNFGIEHFCAIEQASSAMSKFGSIPEAIACIELLHIGVRVIPQQKIGRYKVDFCLPDEKIVIEIDGALYHQNPNKEYWRDVELKKLLGDEWLIKHIPAETLKENHSLFGKSMKKLINGRRKELNIR